MLNAYALAADGAPTGLLGQKWWRREARKKRKDCQHRTVDEKETRYWLSAIRGAALCLTAVGGRAWFQLDRGGDRYATLKALHESEQWFTVRSTYAHRFLVGRRRTIRLRHAVSESKVWVLALEKSKAPREHAAVEIAQELVPHEGRQRRDQALLGSGFQRAEVVRDNLVERTELGPALAVRGAGTVRARVRGRQHGSHRRAQAHAACRACSRPKCRKLQASVSGETAGRRRRPPLAAVLSSPCRRRTPSPKPARVCATRGVWGRSRGRRPRRFVSHARPTAHAEDARVGAPLAARAQRGQSHGGSGLRHDQWRRRDSRVW